MTDRFITNAETVREIGKKLGFTLLSYSPNWGIKQTQDVTIEDTNPLLVYCDTITGRNDTIPDWLMARLSRLYKLPWEYEVSEEELKLQIKRNKEFLNYLDKEKVFLANLHKDSGYSNKEDKEYINQEKQRHELAILNAESELKERQQ